MQDISIKKYQLVIALVTLAGTLIVAGVSVYQQTENTQRLGTLDIAIKDSEGLRKALLKPLEGVWDVKVDYDKFHDEDDYEAEGKAIFIWKPERNKYLIYVGMGASKEEGTFDNCVTWFLESSIKANQFGIPHEKLTLEFKYIYRTGIEPFNHPGKRRVVTEMNYIKPDTETEQHIIKGEYVTSKDSMYTKSTITFTKE